MPHKDPEVRKAYHRQWHAEHREEALARMKRDYQRDKPERREKMRQWYLKNPEWQREARYRSRQASPWKRLLDIAAERAAKKGVPFELTTAWATERWTGRCEVTGLPFVIGARGSGPKPRSPSIDRIKPELGYTPENCQFVLACVNSFKHSGNESEMFEVAQAIVTALSPKYSSECSASNTSNSHS